MGPLKCSNSMDKIGKKCAETGEHLYSYKGQVKVMPLAMVDDLLAINSCGDKSLNMNIMSNSSIEMKKLGFHTPDEKGMESMLESRLLNVLISEYMDVQLRRSKVTPT